MRKKTTEEFIQQAIEKHGSKYTYDKTIYRGNKYRVIITCPDHGDFVISPFNHISNNKNTRGDCSKCANIRRGKNVKLDLDELKDRLYKSHNGEYCYDHITKYADIKDKITLNCKRHGEFDVSIHSHLYSNTACPDCSRMKRQTSNLISTDEFISRSTALHNNKYDYSKSIYLGCYDKVSIICPEHGEFSQAGFLHLQGSGCPVCGNNKSKYETLLCNFFDQYNIKYISRERSIISPYELDLFFPDHSIAIEVNGLYWHGERYNEDRSYHLHKTNLCRDKNIRLIHYTDLQLQTNERNILSQLKSIFKIDKRRIQGRKCEVRCISKQLKSSFLKKYHIQGNDKSNIDLGLFYKDRLVSVMTFCKLRISTGNKSQTGHFELSRYCCINNFSIIGGAQKLLKHFERNYLPEKIISYADASRSVGELYNTLGFKQTHISRPNYWYFKRSNYLYSVQRVYHRFGFNKQVIKQKLPLYDDSKTEWENMKLNGYDRYWDCGNYVFTKC